MKFVDDDDDDDVTYMFCKHNVTVYLCNMALLTTMYIRILHTIPLLAKTAHNFLYFSYGELDWLVPTNPY